MSSNSNSKLLKAARLRQKMGLTLTDNHKRALEKANPNFIPPNKQLHSAPPLNLSSAPPLTFSSAPALGSAPRSLFSLSAGPALGSAPPAPSLFSFGSNIPPFPEISKKEMEKMIQQHDNDEKYEPHYEHKKLNSSEISNAVPEQIAWRAFPTHDIIYNAIKNATNSSSTKLEHSKTFIRNAYKMPVDVLQRMDIGLEFGMPVRFKIKPKEFFENIGLPSSHNDKRFHAKNLRYYPPEFPWLNGIKMDEANERQKRMSPYLYTEGKYDKSYRHFMAGAAIVVPSDIFISIPTDRKYNIQAIHSKVLNELILYDTFEIDGILTKLKIEEMYDAFVSPYTNINSNKRDPNQPTGSLYMPVMVLNKASIIITYEGKVYRTYVHEVNVPFSFIDQFAVRDEQDLMSGPLLSRSEQMGIPSITLKTGRHGGTRRIRTKRYRRTKRSHHKNN
jgi:hypothetical protein